MNFGNFVPHLSERTLLRSLQILRNQGLPITPDNLAHALATIADEQFPAGRQGEQQGTK